MVSMINKCNIFVLCLLALFSSPSLVQAQTLEFDPDELPAESVVPKLDSNMAVKNKSIPLKERLEFGFTYGFIIDEMFFNNNMAGVQAYYNLNDEQALGLKYSSRMSGLSDYSQQFESSSVYINRAPVPTAIVAANYRWSFLYGKVSFSKEMVLPTLFSTEFELGTNKIGTQTLPYSSVGVTQKLYMKKAFGLGLTYRLLVYQTVDPVSTHVGNCSPSGTPTCNTPVYPNESDFSKKIQISQSLELGFSYLF